MSNFSTENSMLLSRRSALAGGLLLVTSAAAASLKLREKISVPMRKPLGDGIPHQLGRWTASPGGGVVRPPEEDSEKSLYDQEVSRVYVSGNQSPIMLLIAYGSTQSDTLQVHRPEFCYPAAGFDIQPREEVQVSDGAGRPVASSFFTAVRGDRVEQILYFTRLGDQFPTSWLRQHVSRVKNSMRGIVPDGILVRASMIEPDRALARAALSEFMTELVRRSSPIAKRALIGQSAG
jgi:EpsI family protein